MNKIIAITGGIGSGKSTALKIVEKQGYKTFSADKIYSELILEEDFIKEISLALGVSILTVDGKACLNKSEISSKVFNDKNALKTLNSITHPRIMQNMLDRAKAQNGFVFCEVPLLFEGGFEDLFDYVFIIKRDDKVRFENASIRDGKTVEQIEEIAKNQFDYAKIQENAHTFIIENNGNETALAEKIELAIKNIQK